jgi:hypothetical protein
MKDTVIVTAPKPRRRAGYRFGPHPVEIDRVLLTDAQMEALKSDPFLRITVDTAEAAQVEAHAEGEGLPPETEAEVSPAAAPAAPVKPAKPKKS